MIALTESVTTEKLRRKSVLKFNKRKTINCSTDSPFSLVIFYNITFMFTKGASVKVKQLSQVNNSIIKNLYVKPLNWGNLVNFKKDCSFEFF